MFHSGVEEVHEALAADFARAGRVVILCGAGISRDSPTCLPLAWEIRKLFHDAIRDAALDICGETVVDWAFVNQMMPESILSSLFSVFAYDVFRFMDPFFERRPNADHENLVRLALSGAISDIIIHSVLSNCA